MYTKDDYVIVQTNEKNVRQFIRNNLNTDVIQIVTGEIRFLDTPPVPPADEHVGTGR